MEKMPRKQSDLPSLYSAYEDLHNRSSASDFSPAEKTVLEEVRTRIKQAEVEELSHNPGLEKIFSVIVEHVDEVRSAVSILEEMRRYMRVLETEQETTLLHKALDDYQEKMSHLRSLQEEIEDNIQLFTQKQGKAGGLFLTVSEFIEPIQPLFIDQYDKDEVFRGLIQVPEVASDQTLPPRPADQNLTVTIKRPQLPRATGTAASTLHNRLAPYATAYDLLRKSNAPRANVVAAWNDKKNAFERFMNEITARQDIEPDQRAQLVKSAHALLRPNESLEPEQGTLASIEAVREMHQKVRAKYSAVQHTLTLEQRRHMRTQIAQLTSMVYDAELAHKIAHATEHAPALAHASFAIHRTGKQR